MIIKIILKILHEEWVKSLWILQMVYSYNVHECRLYHLTLGFGVVCTWMNNLHTLTLWRGWKKNIVI